LPRSHEDVIECIENVKQGGHNLSNVNLQNRDPGNLAWGLKSIDPSRFDDPVAMQTEWFAVNGGALNFRTQKLVQIDHSELQFKTFLLLKLISFLFLVAGLGLTYANTLALSGQDSYSIDSMLITIGLSLAIMGGCMLYSSIIPIVFDKSRGFFWKGRKAPVNNGNPLKDCVELVRIHALQLIRSRAGSSSRYVCELNLVLENGKRLNVVTCGGNPDKLRTETEILSEFLRKPVWDAI
jgi:hypothetical protein